MRNITIQGAGLENLTLAVKETGGSRHNGETIPGPPEAPQFDRALISGGFQGSPQFVLMIPRDASLSDSYKSDSLNAIVFPERIGRAW